MLDNYGDQVRYPGKYEGESPMVPYLYENSHWYADFESGNVESPTGWFMLAGRWIIREDSNGFVYGSRFPLRADALATFEVLETEFAVWDSQDIF